jgi:hypothetical protein
VASAVIQMSDALAEAGKLTSPFAAQLNGLVAQFGAAIKAASSTMPPRAMLVKVAVGFMRAISDAPMVWWASLE